MSRERLTLCAGCLGVLLVVSGLAAGPNEQRRAKAREAAFMAILAPELARLYQALPDSLARARWE